MWGGGGLVDSFVSQKTRILHVKYSIWPLGIWFVTSGHVMIPMYKGVSGFDLTTSAMPLPLVRPPRVPLGGLCRWTWCVGRRASRGSMCQGVSCVI